MKFLRVVLKLCPQAPADAYAHLGFQIQNGKLVHVVATPRGVVHIVAKCEECLLYKLLSVGYVKSVELENRRLVVVVGATQAVKKLLRNNLHVVKVETVSHRRLVLTERQRAVLRRVAEGRGLGEVAKELGVTKVAVYKIFKKALEKAALLI